MPVPPSIVAFGFANLAMLGWLAAAAAPILIHLWMRQTRRETTWAAIRFLQAAIERQARKLRVQHLILLAVRTLLVACIVLAAAKPFFDRPGALAGLGGGVHQVIVIDASLSMQATSGGESRFARAKRVARDIVSAAGSTDRFTVIAMTEQSSVVASSVSSKAAAARAIDTLAPTAGEANPTQTLALAGRLLGFSANGEEGQATKGPARVTFVTDLDAATWSDATDEGGSAREAIASLSEAGPITAIDVTEPSPSGNASIARLRFSEKLLNADRPVTVVADIAWRRGDTPLDTQASLEVNGRVVATQPLTVQPGATAPVAFTHTFAEEGDIAVAVRVADDSLVADNQRFRVAPVRRRTAVLCVAGAPGADRYVASALNPTGDRESVVAVDRVTDADLASIDLSQYACVFCCNVPALTRGEATRLADFARAGGGVVFFLGDRVDTDAYNRRFGSAADETLSRNNAARVFRLASIGGGVATPPSHSPLLPITIGEPVSQDATRIDPLDYTHPIIEPFRGRERAGLITAPVMRYCRLGVAEGDQRASIGLATASGDPLLMTAPAGRGRVAVVATAASLESVDPVTGGPWTAWPAWPSFLPVVRGLLEYTAGAAADAPTPTVGQPLSGPQTAGSPPPVVRPDGANDEAIPAAGGEWLYADTDLPGVYRVGDETSYAVNTSDAESSLAPVDQRLLPAELQVIDAASFAGGESPAQQQTPLHRLLLYVAIGLAILDTLLACWFGRGSV